MENVDQDNSSGMQIIELERQLFEVRSEITKRIVINTRLQTNNQNLERQVEELSAEVAQLKTDARKVIVEATVDTSCPVSGTTTYGPTKSSADSRVDSSTVPNSQPMTREELNLCEELKRDNKELHRTIRDLRRKLEQADNSRGSVLMQAIEQQEQIHKNTTETLRSEYHREHERVLKIEAEKRQLELKLEDANMLVSRYQQISEQYYKEKQDLEQQLREAAKKPKRLQLFSKRSTKESESVVELEHQIEQLQGTVRRLEDDLQSERKNAVAQRESMEEKERQHGTQMELLQSKMQTEVERLRLQADTQRTQVDDAARQIRTLNRQIQKAEAYNRYLVLELKEK